MEIKSTAVKVFLWLALLFCLAVLGKYILFKKNPRYYKHYFAHEYKRYTVKEGWKQANTSPFSTIRLFTSSRRMREEYVYRNIGGNIIGFIPLGFLLPLLLPWLRGFWRVTGCVLLISLCFEIAQLLTGIGICDIDDLILNTTGGMLGYALYRVVKWLTRDDDKL